MDNSGATEGGHGSFYDIIHEEVMQEVERGMWWERWVERSTVSAGKLM